LKNAMPQETSVAMSGRYDEDHVAAHTALLWKSFYIHHITGIKR